MFSGPVQAPLIVQYESDFIILQGSAVRAVISPVSLKFASLGSFLDRDDINYSQLLLLEEIIRRESGGDPNACNTCEGTKWEGLYNPNDCPCGAGLAGLIPSTIKYCEEKLGKSIDPFNSNDNLECAIWLLKNEGIRHWEEYSGPY